MSTWSRLVQFITHPQRLITGWFRKLVKCVSFQYGDTCYAPGCSSRLGKTNECKAMSKYNRHASDFKDVMQSALGDEFKIISLELVNDWLNGSLYFPLWEWYKSRKRTYLFGLFRKKARNYYCDANKKDNYKHFKIRELCQFKNLEDHKDNKLNKGVIYQTENADGLDLYYYSVGEGQNRLYATDIILLGSFNDCDMDGVPPLYKYLPPTTANIPPFISSKDGGNDNEDDESEASLDEKGEILITGMDRGKNNSDQLGLFFELDCSSYYTDKYTCANLDRICELGVVLDGQYKDEYLNVDIEADGMIKRDEIENTDIRAMFATLNGNGLDVLAKDPATTYGTYKFKYTYPTNFDGKLNNEVADNAYINFRYGADHQSLKTFQLTENSFYFYFGLKPGNTAIEKFRQLYYSECEEKEPYEISAKISTTGTPECNDDEKATVNIEFIGCHMPIDYKIYDGEDNVFYHKDASVSTNDTITSGDTSDWYNGTFKLSVVDSNGTPYESLFTIQTSTNPMTIDYTKVNIHEKYVEDDTFPDKGFGSLTITSATINGVNGSFSSLKLIRHDVTSSTENSILDVFSGISSSKEFQLSAFTEGQDTEKYSAYVDENEIKITGICPSTIKIEYHYKCKDDWMPTEGVTLFYADGEKFDAFINGVPMRFLDSASFTASTTGIDMWNKSVWSNGLDDPRNYNFPNDTNEWMNYVDVSDSATSAVSIAQYELSCMAALCKASYFNDNGDNTFILTCNHQEDCTKSMMTPNYGYSEFTMMTTMPNDFFSRSESEITTWTYTSANTQVSCDANYPNIVHSNYNANFMCDNFYQQDTYQWRDFTIHAYNQYTASTSITDQTDAVATISNKNGYTQPLLTSYNPFITCGANDISHNYFRVYNKYLDISFPSNSTEFTGETKNNYPYTAANEFNDLKWFRADFNDKRLTYKGSVYVEPNGLWGFNLVLDGGIVMAQDENHNIIGENLEYSYSNGILAKNNNTDVHLSFYSMVLEIDDEEIQNFNINSSVTITTQINGQTYTSEIAFERQGLPLESARLVITECSYDFEYEITSDSISAFTQPGRVTVIDLGELQRVKKTEEYNLAIKSEGENDITISGWTSEYFYYTIDDNEYGLIPMNDGTAKNYVMGRPQGAIYCEDGGYRIYSSTSLTQNEPTTQNFFNQKKYSGNTLISRTSNNAGVKSHFIPHIDGYHYDDTNKIWVLMDDETNTPLNNIDIYGCINSDTDNDNNLGRNCLFFIKTFDGASYLNHLERNQTDALHPSTFRFTYSFYHNATRNNTFDFYPNGYNDGSSDWSSVKFFFSYVDVDDESGETDITFVKTGSTIEDQRIIVYGNDIPWLYLNHRFKYALNNPIHISKIIVDNQYYYVAPTV